MRGGIRAAALPAALLLFGAACTIPTGTSQTAQGTPSQETTPSQQASPSGNATSTPAGTTETPSSQATPPSSAPAGTPPSKLIILNFSMHVGEVALGYSPVTIGGAGGTPPYHWSIGGGALPGGLSISSSGGVISGTPTVAGGFNFVVLLQDSAGQAAGVSRSVTVITALTASAPCAKQCIVGQGCSVCGGFGNASGGLPPYTYALSGGSTPPKGMSWSGLALSGPFPQGSYSLAVAVRDQLGAQLTVNANWSIYGPATLSGGTGCTNAGNPPMCTATGWSYSGGNPTTAPSVSIVGYSQYCQATFCYPVPTTPPPGWSVSATNGVITISAGGISCGGNTYGGYLTLELIDTANCPTTLASNQVNLLVWLENNC
jgi:hypothetical protein